MYREFLELNMRLAVVVNPDAGLGGRLGFKGSDGRASEARAAGAQDRSGPRMLQCLEKLAELARESIEICHKGRCRHTFSPNIGDILIP